MGLLRALFDWLGLWPENASGRNGYGEVGGNGSLHWKTVNGTRAVELESSVPFKVGDVGADKGHPGRFRVQLRYPSLAEAEAARTALPIRSENGIVFVDIDVPALARESMQQNPPAEVRVNW